jgi:hypothetical protein
MRARRADRRGGAAAGRCAHHQPVRALRLHRRSAAPARILLGIIRGKGPLRPKLDPRRGEDILSSYMASDVYLRLVHRLGWIAEDFQRWLEATLAWQLLGTG